MSRPRKLSDEKIAWVEATVAQRRAIPNNGAMARLLGVSKRLIDDIASGKAYRVPRGTAEVNVTLLPNEVLDPATPKP